MTQIAITMVVKALITMNYITNNLTNYYSYIN